jgi:hypothetical protein
MMLPSARSRIRRDLSVETDRVRHAGERFNRWLAEGPRRTLAAVLTCSRGSNRMYAYTQEALITNNEADFAGYPGLRVENWVGTD